MRIFNFGSLNVDRVYGVREFVRAGETVQSQSYREFPGGKGLNQSVAAARAGADVVHVGAVGIDGGLLTDALEQEGVSLAYLNTLPCETGHAVIQVTVTGQNAILVHPGANASMEKAWVDAALREALPGDIALLQNEISNVPYIMRRAREAGLGVAFNPSPITDALMEYPLSLVTLFLLNEVEGAALTGETEVGRILEGLTLRFPDADIVLTLGERGSLYSGKSGRASFGAYAVDAVDTTAAGDTFTGYYLACIARGMEPTQAMLYATAASAISVTQAGASTSIPRFSEIPAFIRTHGNIQQS